MARRRHTTVSVEVDVFDVLAEAETADLINELDARAAERSDANANAYRRGGLSLEADWQRLADLIAVGGTREALGLLHDLCPTTTHTAAATLRFVEARRQH